MRTTLVTAPTEEWITADELREHPACRIDTTADDGWLHQLITAARQRYEELTQRVLISSTWDLYLDEFPGEDYIELPAILTSVTSLKYQDSSDVQQTWAASNYVVTTVAEPVARLSLAYGETWPTTYGEPDDIVLRFVAGYTTANLPVSLKNWLCVWVAGTYDGNQPLVDIAENMMRANGRWAI